jgi:hypothetical protein
MAVQVEHEIAPLRENPSDSRVGKQHVSGDKSAIALRHPKLQENEHSLTQRTNDFKRPHCRRRFQTKPFHPAVRVTALPTDDQQVHFVGGRMTSPVNACNDVFVRTKMNSACGRD